MRGATLLAVVTIAVPVAARAEHVRSAREIHEIRSVVGDYAACVVARHYSTAKNLIVSDGFNDDIVKRDAQLIDGACLGQVAGSVELTFPGDLYRYALAEALIKHDFLKDGPASFSDRLPLAQPPIPAPHEPVSSPSNQNKQDPATVAREKKTLLAILAALTPDQLAALPHPMSYSDAVLSHFGECIARSDAPNSRLWVLTPPDGPEESSRIRAMMPALQSCLSPGVTIKFGKVQLRGAVALNYARLAYATPLMTSGAVH